MKIKTNEINTDVKSNNPIKAYETNKSELNLNKPVQQDVIISEKNKKPEELVHISNEARKKLEEESNSEFNASKVSQLKSQIENGTYEFNFKRVAEKLIGFEK